MPAYNMARVLAVCWAVASASSGDSQRRDRIEVSIASSVQASPKNSFGRLDVHVASRVVQRFFAREHSWHADSGGALVGSVVREANRGGRGLSAGDIVKAIETIQRGIPPAVASSPSVESAPGRCVSLKASLVNISHVGTGRIPLEVFEAEHAVGENAIVDAVRAVGALEAARDTNPRVLIANYMASSAHCLSSGIIQSECCVSECENIMSGLEFHLQAPIVAPERLLHFVRKISCQRLGSRAIPQPLQQKLYEIADEHDGQVHLHGDIFATWLHYAFPNDCPLPCNSGHCSNQEKLSSENRPDAADGTRVCVGHEYAVDTMLAAYVAGRPQAHATCSQATVSSTSQDLGRLAVMGLIGFAMLRTGLAYMWAASSTLQNVAQDDHMKKDSKRCAD